MITRSGTNDLHGTGFLFRRQPSLNANEWQNANVGAQKEAFYQNIEGFSVGGPVQKNKCSASGTCP